MPLIKVFHSYEFAPDPEDFVGAELLAFCRQLAVYLEKNGEDFGLHDTIVKAGAELAFVQYGRYDLKTYDLRFELKFEVVLSEAAQMKLRDELAERIRKSIGMFIGSPAIRLDVYAGAWHGAIIDYSRIEPTW